MVEDGQLKNSKWLLLVLFILCKGVIAEVTPQMLYEDYTCKDSDGVVYQLVRGSLKAYVNGFNGEPNSWVFIDTDGKVHQYYEGQKMDVCVPTKNRSSM